MTRRTPESLRSTRWFAPDDLRSFGHRSRMMQMGYSDVDWVGKPVIAIVNTWSDINPCHAHFKERVADIKRGVLQAGGFPLELPAISLAETFVKPTTMLYRNLLAMETEELLRSHPVDGVVLMGGCDKTTPGLLLGAISAGYPCIYMPAGPMLRGNWKGSVLGSGSDAWKFWDERRAGNITTQDWGGLEGGIARSYGTCMTMGTAATMTGIAEAMGMCLPGASSIPCRRFASPAHGGRLRTPRGRHGVGGPDASTHPRSHVVRQRDHRSDGDGLLDQRDHPRDRARAPRRRVDHHRRFRCGQPQGTGARQYPSQRRQVPDGGFLLRRRHARAALAARRPSATRSDDGHRAARWARTSPAPKCSTTT